MTGSETPEPTAESVISGLFHDTGLGARPDLIPVYIAATLALRDHENAATLRAAGHTAAADILEPDPAVIAAAWGPEDQ
ncbi:hypothetical protein ACIP93_33855 [Streptomyces sp. NPDC088745]|uniref:hypothetical protein n=1 Tax=Streptomyces sp. NPDC088745 TaxID=3365884 RepID=UPI00380D4283